MAKLGVEIKKGHRWGGVRRGPDGRLRCELASGEVLECEQLLFAAGRIGRSAGLNLDAIGVRPDERGGIPVDGSYRTSAPSVYAAGDVIWIRWVPKRKVHAGCLTGEDIADIRLGKKNHVQ